MIIGSAVYSINLLNFISTVSYFVRNPLRNNDNAIVIGNNNISRTYLYTSTYNRFIITFYTEPSHRVGIGIDGCKDGGALTDRFWRIPHSTVNNKSIGNKHNSKKTEQRCADKQHNG